MYKSIDLIYRTFLMLTFSMKNIDQCDLKVVVLEIVVLVLKQLLLKKLKHLTEVNNTDKNYTMMLKIKPANN